MHSDRLLSSLVNTIRVQRHMTTPQKLAIASCAPAILSSLCPQLVAGAKSTPPSLDRTETMDPFLLVFQNMEHLAQVETAKWVLESVAKLLK